MKTALLSSICALGFVIVVSTGASAECHYVSKCGLKPHEFGIMKRECWTETVCSQAANGGNPNRRGCHYVSHCELKPHEFGIPKRECRTETVCPH